MQLLIQLIYNYYSKLEILRSTLKLLYFKYTHILRHKHVLIIIKNFKMRMFKYKRWQGIVGFETCYIYFTPLANDNRVLMWTLSTILPFFIIVGGIIFAITFWKYHANMIILREIQQGMFKVKFFFKVFIHAYYTLNIFNINFLNLTSS